MKNFFSIGGLKFDINSNEYKLWCQIINDIYMEFDTTIDAEMANKLVDKIQKLLELVSKREAK